MTSPQDVLRFWFEETPEEKWFNGGEAFDDEIRERFGDLHAAAAAGDLDSWADEPRSRLALIIVLDQFSRNLHRGDAVAFANDTKALQLAMRIVEEGTDTDYPDRERGFIYLPFQHSEEADVQAQSLKLYRALTDDPEHLSYAERHKEIIDRFGRFPHRNEVLGRRSTAEELAFLREPNSSF